MMINPSLCAAIGRGFTTACSSPTSIQQPKSQEAVKETATKIEGVSVFRNTFKKIAKGALKIVWVPLSHVAAAGTDVMKSVYYTPVDSWWKSSTEELRKEVKKMKDIQAEVDKRRGAGKHLALKAEEQDPWNRINGRYTVKTQKAEGCFEKRISHPDTSLEDRIRFGGHLLEGLSDLHEAGYVHGDMKPENCLIYQENGAPILKISDFGKAKKKKEDDSPQSYSGNTRFAPPEGKLSTKSDVYGAAISLIRNFEEMFIGKTGQSLLKIDPTDRDMDAPSDLRGIDKFIVEHKAFPAYPRGAASSWWTKLKRRIMMKFRSSNEKAAQTAAMHRYIDALGTNLRLDVDTTTALCNLLKRMTETDPEKRISAKDAANEYKRILHPVE